MPKESPPLTYGSYLKVTELLSLQTPLSHPQAHDEMLFIIIHQAYELWFKLVLFEMDSLIAALERDHLHPSLRSLDRISEVFRVLIHQVDILETMTPVEFNRFRSHLNPASGFQSAQFREIELVSGADKEEISKLLGLNPEWSHQVQKRFSKPSLRDALQGLLHRRGLISKSTSLSQAIKKIYYDEKLQDLHALCEGLIRFDELVSLWRFRHVQMVERMIGMKKGTGGSLGVTYLQSTLKKRFFSELWEARTEMNGEKPY